MIGLALCLGASAMLLGMLLGASVYESVVVSYSWQARPAEAVALYRSLAGIVTPARFFRAVAPATQVALLAAAACGALARVHLLWVWLALAAAVASDAITFRFHYPRNHALFGDGPRLEGIEREALIRQWRQGNLVRAMLVAFAFLATLRALWLVALRVR